jgi:hypothetical protein
MVLQSALRKVGRGLALVPTLVILMSTGLHSADKPFIRCSPTLLRPGDTLTLSMSLPHPAELAVRHPDGTPFFLVYEPGSSVPSGWRPLYSKEAFRKMGEVTLKVDRVMGTPWVGGRDSNEPIFTVAGVYVFTLTEVLETEDLPLYQCTVRYSAAPR